MERTGGGGFGGDHPEGLREDRGDDRHVGERNQVDEVPVLERPGEEHVSSGHRLQLVAIVAEADDHGLGTHALESLEQELNALVPDQLAEVENRRRFLREELFEPLGVALVGEPLVRAAGFGWSRRLLEQLGERLGRASG